MKKLITIIAAMAVTVGAYAQGTVNFANRVGSSPSYTVNAPIYNTDGVTPLSGSGFLAQLYYFNGSSFVSVAGTAPFFSSTANAGIFNAGAGATKTLTGVAAGSSVQLQVRAWSTSGGAFTSYESAVAGSGIYGSSATFSVNTGGVPDPVTGIPSAPANLVGLQSFSIAAVPEPSTYALGAMALGSLLFIRRRK